MQVIGLFAIFGAVLVVLAIAYALISKKGLNTDDSSPNTPTRVLYTGIALFLFAIFTAALSECSSDNAEYLEGEYSHLDNPYRR